MISSNPTASELVQYEAWLTEANAAYFRLLSGSAEVSVSYNGESATYTGASKPQLLALIGQLRRALGMAPLANPGVAFRGVVFGSR